MERHPSSFSFRTSSFVSVAGLPKSEPRRCERRITNRERRTGTQPFVLPLSFFLFRIAGQASFSNVSCGSKRQPPGNGGGAKLQDATGAAGQENGMNEPERNPSS